MLPQGLLTEEQQRNFNRRGMGAAIADGLLAFGGISPYASQAVAGQRRELEQGLLAQRQAEDEQARMNALWQQAGAAMPPQVGAATPQPTRIPDSPMFARRAQPGEAADAQGLIAPQAQEPAGGLLTQGAPTSAQMYNMAGLLSQNNMFDEAEQVRQQAEAMQQQELRQASDAALASYLDQGLISQEEYNLYLGMPLNQRAEALTSTTTLSPGQTRVDRFGQTVATLPSSTQQKVEEYMRLYGLTEAEAFSAASGDNIVNVDDRGNVVVTNRATGESVATTAQREIPPLPDFSNASAVEPYAAPPTTSMLAGATPATGIRARVQAWGNAAAGLVGLNEPFPQTGDFLNYMSRLQRQSFMRMSEDWPGRPSNYIVEQFRELTFDPNKLWQGDQEAVRSLRSFTELLSQDIDNKTRAYGRQETTPDERAKLVDQLTTLHQLRNDYTQAIELFENNSRLVNPPQLERALTDQFSRQQQAYQRNWGN